MAEQANWYVAHTYSGYENKVATDLMTMVENRHLQDLICDVKVPTETRIEEVFDKRGNKTGEKEVQSKLYPGYVFIKMVMNDNTWYIVRNTRGCTGFVGPESKPEPLTRLRLPRWASKPPLTLRSSTRSVIRLRSPPVRWKAPSAPSTRSTFLRARCA